MSLKEKWLDYPTITGWWWGKKEGEEPKMCRVVEKHEGVIIAIFPEEEKYIYLDKVYDIWKWQKVKDFERE